VPAPPVPLVDDAALLDAWAAEAPPDAAVDEVPVVEPAPLSEDPVAHPTKSTAIGADQAKKRTRR
jgi:hypothetical protein